MCFWLTIGHAEELETPCGLEQWEPTYTTDKETETQDRGVTGDPVGGMEPMSLIPCPLGNWTEQSH